MNIHLHSFTTDSCLADLDRDGYARGADPAGFTVLVSQEAARELVAGEERAVDERRLIECCKRIVREGREHHWAAGMGA